MFQALNDVGFFTIPTNTGVHRVGEAMRDVNYVDLKAVPDTIRKVSAPPIRSAMPLRHCGVRNRRSAAMAGMLAVYKRPTDVKAFEEHYFGTHIPMAKKMPGLLKYEVSQGPITTLAGPDDVHLIGALYFADLDAMKTAFASPEGRATAADRQLYAPDDTGVQIFAFDTREV